MGIFRKPSAVVKTAKGSIWTGTKQSQTNRLIRKMEREGYFPAQHVRRAGKNDQVLFVKADDPATQHNSTDRDTDWAPARQTFMKSGLSLFDQLAEIRQRAREGQEAARTDPPEEKKIY